AELVRRHPNAMVQLKLLTRPDPLPEHGFARARTARWHGVRLEGPLPDVMARVHPNCRQAARRALKCGILVRGLSRGELSRFYALHCQVRKSRFRLLPQPIEL